MPARVCVFLFTKDSPLLLRSWLEHYLALFAAAAITVVDHSSADAGALALLRAAAAKGVRVDTFRGSFRRKHGELTARMRRRGASCDFLVPADNDELLVVHEVGGGYRADRAAVGRAFDRLLPTARAGRRYKLGAAKAVLCDASLCAARGVGDRGASYKAAVRVPRRPTGLADKPPGGLCQDKTFFAAASFAATDQGNHYGRLRGEGRAFEERAARSCGASMRHAFFYPVHHGLAFVDLGGALPHAAFASKYLRGAAAYNYSAASRCSRRGWGHHYCEALKGKSLSNATDYCQSMRRRCVAMTRWHILGGTV
jgi:hypothetical protein